jgi:putative endonuclease
MRHKQYYIYIVTNKNNTTLYTGFTNDLCERIQQHKEQVIEGFTSRYNIDKLVYFEEFDNAYDAITREKQIKAGSRKKKIDLIERDNSEWRDLSEDW